MLESLSTVSGPANRLWVLLMPLVRYMMVFVAAPFQFSKAPLVKAVITIGWRELYGH